MGSRYSFELFYPVNRVREGLGALNNYVPTVHRKRTIGKTQRPSVDLAATDLSGLAPTCPLFLMLSLLFPADDHVRNFRGDWDDREAEWDDEGTEYLPIGPIDLSVRVGMRYAVLSFTARVSTMSDLFQKSRAIWNHFDRMLRGAGGIVGLFQGVDHPGPAEFPLLPDGRIAVVLNYRDFILEERELYVHIDVDRYTETVLTAISYCG